MIKSQKLISLPVISLEDGLEVGIVRDLVIKPSAKVVYALIVDQRKWFKDQKIIPFSKIRSIGDDAITIEQNNSAQKPANLPEMVGLIKENVALIEAKVIAEDGTTLGFVEEYYVDRHTGAILQLELGGNFLNSLLKGNGLLAADYIKTMGKKVLVASEGAAGHLRQIDGGLPETLRNLKDSSRHLLGNSWDKTVDMGKTLSRKLDKFTSSHAGDQPQVPNDVPSDIPTDTKTDTHASKEIPTDPPTVCHTELTPVDPDDAQADPPDCAPQQSPDELPQAPPEDKQL